MNARYAAPLALPAMLLALSAPGAADLSVSALEVQPRLDVRARAGSDTDETLRLMQAEVNIRLSLAKNDEELVTFSLAPNVETDMSGRGRQMHFSNYYSVWNFGADKPKLKLGQFVVPFGTLAEYDTHPLILQTPYARTLGIRLDRGLEADGFAGDWDYQAALTTGDGRHRTDGSYAATLRIARDFEQGDDAYRVGVSLLHGEQMPVLPITPMSVPHAMPAMGGMHSLQRADKDRVAVDLDWLHGIDNIRAELVAGRDDGEFVHGEWLQWSHPFSYDTELIVQGDYWHGSNGVAYGLGASLHHRLDDLSGLRVAYEPRWAKPDMEPEAFAGMATVQYYRNFNLSF